MTFSVIIPVYRLLDENICLYFDKLMHSLSICISSNSFVQEKCTEILIINDLPSQDVSEVIISIAKKYKLSNITLVNNEQNYGQAYSRNRGALLASGEYLHFIDQDDYVSDDFYNNILSSKPVDILLSSPYLFITSTNKEIPYYGKTLLHFYSKAKKVQDLQLFILSNIAVSPGQYLISRSLFTSIGGFTDLRNRGSDDWGLFVKLLNKKIPISLIFISKAVFYYRLHMTQGMKTLDIRASVKEQCSSITFKGSPVLKLLVLIKNCILFSIPLKVLSLFLYNIPKIKH